MEPNTTSQHERQRRRLGLLALGALALAVVAMGCHINSSATHMWSQHWGNIYFPIPVPILDERWCVDMTSQFMGPAPASPDISTVTARIDDALTGNQNEDWQNVAGGLRVDFVSIGDCDSYDATTSPKRSEIQMEYHISSNTIAKCGMDNISCVFRLPQDLFTWTDGHQDYLKTYLMIDVDLINTGSAASNRHHINHESGHAVGLGDPNVICPSPGGSQCGIVSIFGRNCLLLNAEGQKIWVDSVMHETYYCGGEIVEAGPSPTNREWPTGLDRYQVDTISHGRGLDRP